MLGEDVADNLPELRAEAESRMTDRVRFFKQVKTFPPGAIDPVWSDENLYVDVPARVRFKAATVFDREAVSQLVVSQTLEIHVPVGSVPDVLPDVLCEVTGSASDPGAVGIRARVSGIPPKGQVTAWRFPVEAVS